MKTFMTILCIMALGMTTAQAQTPGLDPASMIEKIQNMSPEEQAIFMQQLQKKTMQISQCMGNIDHNQLNEFAARSEAFSQHVQSLCEENKRRDAQLYAYREGRKLMNEPIAKAMRKCSSDTVKSFEKLLDDPEKNEHVCDGWTQAQ